MPVDMKFETVEIEDLGKVEGTVPATLHYHEDKEVFLKIIDESPDSNEKEQNDFREDIIDMAMENKTFDEKFEYLKNAYIITKK